MIKFKQQDTIGLEKYIDLDCDLSIHQNTYAAPLLLENYFSESKLKFLDIVKIIFERQCNKKIFEIDPKILSKLTIIETTATFKFKSEQHKQAWKKDKLYEEYSKYKGVLEYSTVQPIMLITKRALNRISRTPINNLLYQVDGMHRIMSALEDGVNEIKTYVVACRQEIYYFIPEEDRKRISDFGAKCTWFPRYQEIKEVALDGRRKQISRFRDFYDFSILKNKTVVDFGGNIGQSPLEAYYNDAKKIVSFDIQKEALATGIEISKVLNAGIEFRFLDFNKPTFKDDIKNVVESWDWAIFQAIYRTKEINDIESVFEFIVENTKEGIIFEGNGDPNIDTDLFYFNIFKKFNFSTIKKLGVCEMRPAYLLIK
jgi:hypothetical protein